MWEYFFPHVRQSLMTLDSADLMTLKIKKKWGKAIEFMSTFHQELLSSVDDKDDSARAEVSKVSVTIAYVDSIIYNNSQRVSLPGCYILNEVK